jgi:hypothetical protein
MVDNHPNSVTVTVMNGQEIIERIMSQHWDMTACRCWVCDAGRALGYGGHSEYLSHNSKVKVGRVTVDWQINPFRTESHLEKDSL